MKVLILGAGGHAQVIADALLCRLRIGENVELLGFLDDDLSLKGKKLLGFPVLGTFDELEKFSHDALVVGIGDNQTRMNVFERFHKNGKQFLSVVHPSAIIARDVVIEPGSVVFGGVVINTGSVIGANVIINTGATVDHHARIGSHVHIGPGVHLGGTVTIGEGSFLGIGTSVIPNLSIGNWATIGAGSVVLHDLPSNITAVGVPANIIKSHRN